MHVTIQPSLAIRKATLRTLVAQRSDGKVSIRGQFGDTKPHYITFNERTSPRCTGGSSWHLWLCTMHPLSANSEKTKLHGYLMIHGPVIEAVWFPSAHLLTTLHSTQQHQNCLWLRVCVLRFLTICICRRPHAVTGTNIQKAYLCSKVSYLNDKDVTHMFPYGDRGKEQSHYKYKRMKHILLQSAYRKSQ
jgi:hypothetical protein